MSHEDKNKYQSRYKNNFLEKEKANFLSCKVKKREMSKSTSEEMDSFINLHTFGYMMSFKGNDWINETMMLLIGVLASALLSNFVNLTNFNYVTGFILLILILARVIRSRS